MFELGTMLVHPTYGVCEVVHIGKIDMKNVKDERLFYTLVPLYDSKSKLFIPTDSDGLGLRPVMTKESALELVASLPAMEPITEQNEKEREKIFHAQFLFISRTLSQVPKLRQRAKTLPSLEYLEAIADYFNVSIDYLLGRTDERN